MFLAFSQSYKGRTIRIKGKNIDDIDLEKLGNLIEQATSKISKFNFSSVLKKLKSPLNNDQPKNHNR